MGSYACQSIDNTGKEPGKTKMGILQYGIYY